MLIKQHGNEVVSNLRKTLSFDWYDEKGKENYPRIFFVKSFHADTYEEHHVLSSELEIYDWRQWSAWINADTLFVSKRDIKMQDDKYGIRLPNTLEL